MYLQKSVNIYILIVLFMFINGCSQQNTPEDAISCILIEQKCTINGRNSQTLVEFMSPVEIEELISVKIDLPVGQKFIKGYVEGINMNMGKSPFMLTAESNNLVRGEIFLGSCTEPNMQWQLIVLSEDINKKQDTLEQRILFNTNN